MEIFKLACDSSLTRAQHPVSIKHPFNHPTRIFMLEEFKKFILKGNVVDLATGVIIGAAFGNIVAAFTAGVITPILNLIGGAGQNGGLKIWIFDLGIIISAVINFLIVAAVIFFIIVKPANALMARMKANGPAAPPPEPSASEKLLAEIRDSLKSR